MTVRSRDSDRATNSGGYTPPRGTLVFIAIGLGALALFLVSSYAGNIGAGIWWDTKSTATCTITSKSFQSWTGRRGAPSGVAYTIHTQECGTLIVTSGSWSFGIPEANELGSSLEPGHTYEMELRGWHGWPNAPLAIMSAS